MTRKTSPPKLHTLKDDLMEYIVDMATKSKVSPEFREKVLTGNDKFSNRVLEQWLNKLKLSAINKKFKALSSNVSSFHQDEDAQIIELEELNITPQTVYLLGKKIKKPELINTIILRNIKFIDEDTRNDFEKILERFKNVRIVEYDTVDFGNHTFLNFKELTDITIKNSRLSKILLTKFNREVLDIIEPLQRVTFIRNVVHDYFYDEVFYRQRINAENRMTRNMLLNDVLINIQGN